MTIKIKIKRSEASNSVPATSELEVGEICMNVADQKIYTRKSDDSIVTVSETISGKSALGLVSTDTSSTAGPEIDLFRNSFSPFDSDELGKIEWSGENDNGDKKVYAKIQSKLVDASASSEDGELGFHVIEDGTITNVATLKSDGIHFETGHGLHFADGTTLTTSTGSGGGSGIADVVEDTTPQLGGNLDLNNNNISGTGAVTATSFHGDGSALTGVGVDLSSIQSDILKLALHQAIDGNRAAFNLTDSFVDGFEDDTGILTKTDTTRNTSSEYVSSIVETINESSGTPAYETGDRRSLITLTWGGFTFAGGTPNGMLDGVSASYGISAWVAGSPTVTPSAGAYIRYQFSDNNSTGSTKKLITEVKWYQNRSESHGSWRWQGSNDASSWTNIGNAFTLGGTTTQTQTELSGNTTPYTYYQMLWQSGQMDGRPYMQEIQFKQADVTATTGTTVNSTGTLISDSQTASDSRTSASGVIIYEDADGTATLGSDLKIYFTADNGSNWTESSSYGNATTYTGTKKLVSLGNTTVTGGTQVALKGEWANQAEAAAGSYVTGNRASTITVTSDLSISGGAISTLVDGTISSGGGFYPSSAGFNPAGLYIQFQFSTAQTITAVKFHTSNTHEDLGVWKWQGSNDASSWTDVSGNVTLGDAITDIMTLTNSTAYVYYRALGVSGSGDATWVYEMEFEHAGATGKDTRLHGWAVNY